MVAHSYLFVPGNRPDRIAKALKTTADRIVIDLEDAVTERDKAMARQHVAQVLHQRTPRVVVRINAQGTPWFSEDVAMCRAARPDALMLPKAARACQVAEVHDATGAVLLPLIESAQGLAHARAIAVAPGVDRLVFGSLDLQLDLGMSASEDELVAFRCELVLASRLAGLVAPVDGVSASLDDEQGLDRDARRAVRLGFGAKLCIHPRQLSAVHAAFNPSREQLEWARRVLAVVDAADGNARTVDGAMVDAPVIETARRMLRTAGLNTSNPSEETYS